MVSRHQVLPTDAVVIHPDDACKDAATLRDAGGSTGSVLLGAVSSAYRSKII